MEDFKRTVVVGFVPRYIPSQSPVPFAVRIEYQDGKLSITGHSAETGGQCTDELLRTDISWAKGWNRIKAMKLADIWRRWHLNDMRPMCEHQRADGWEKLAKKECTTYHWLLKTEYHDMQRTLKQQIIADASVGKAMAAAEPDSYQCKLLQLLPSETTFTPKTPGKEYVPWEGVTKHHVSTSIAGHTFWISAKNRGACDGHPDGLLGKPCPVCGYEYGGKWLFEEVPDAVIEWLKSC